MESRARQNMINTIKMLSHTYEAFKLIKEMLIEYINEDKNLQDIKSEMINSIKMLPQNSGSFELLEKMLIRRINEDKRYTI
tara:strand:- start:3060 stop:3302 length:243 start_codon:yes stop_codon:yes gene_type:complete